MAQAIANKMKSKGLQKLRWYCQMCQKQCRDDNGFKCHLKSEAHMRQMNIFSEAPGKVLESYTKQFLSDFCKLLSSRYNGRRVSANLVYQDYISDKNHLHMNATRFATLSELVKWLGRQGMCEVEETERGWFVKWIDRSPDTLKKTEAELKRQRMEKTEEEIELRMLENQIKKAQEGVEDDLVEETSNEMVKQAEPISLQLKPSSAVSSTSVFKKPKLKRVNPFSLKSAKSTLSSSVSSGVSDGHSSSVSSGVSDGQSSSVSSSNDSGRSSKKSAQSSNHEHSSVNTSAINKKMSSLDLIIQEEMARKKLKVK